MTPHFTPARRGAVLPLVAVCLIGLFGFVALAVDLGVMTVAHTQCQNAADAAAMAGTRTLNGDAAANNNYSAVAPNARAAAATNPVLGQTLTAGQVQIDVGSYSYDTSQDKFVQQIPRNPADNWSLVKATVHFTGPTFFAKVLGINAFNSTAVATAIHRPRDVAVVLDFSGSMRFSSLPGVPHGNARAATGNTPASGSNNPEGVFPRFGHYNAVASAGLQRTAQATIGSTTYALSNFTAADPTNYNRPPLVEDFYQHAGGAAATPAFTSAGPGDGEGYVAGDMPLKADTNTGAAYAATVAEIFNLSSALAASHASDTAFETGGYDATAFNTGATFQGYTQGPSYWGKTFFVWPPDPRGVTSASDVANNGARDWRKRFFLKNDGVTPVDDNALLWDSTGVWRSPTMSGTNYYRINYRAVLEWLRNTGPAVFPPRLRAGRLLYYDAIPDPADSTLNSRWWTTFPVGNANERFWKEYIDYVLGLRQTGASTWDTPNIVKYTGYGDDYTWGTVKITAQSSLTAVPTPYMHYNDNPRRPRLHFWFGPMTLVDFLGNYNLGSRASYQQHWWWPGTCHEAPLYACKLGIRAALADIQNNHPNDHVSLIMFSVPRTSATDSAGRRFNRVRAPMGRDYARMIDSLWFPPYTLDNPGTEIRPHDFNNNMEVPRAMGGTCYSMGLMLAYNQFSGNNGLATFNPSPAPAGDAGGLGRKGAQKLIVFETDGMPNHTASAGFSNFGPYNSYYNVRYNSASPSSSQFPTVGQYTDNDSAVLSEINAICTQLCALDTASSPGYSTKRRPALIHCIAFGPFVEVGNPGRAQAISTLSQMEAVGNIPAAKRIGSAEADYKIVTGDDATVVNNLQAAFTAIMRDGAQVTLIE